MNFFIDENSTRETIIRLLKKSGGMSIEELSKIIDITPMGIRQHLLALEKRDIVTYVAKKRGIGRPGFIYMLTEEANRLFPSSYDKFALGLLRDIRHHEGDEKIDKIFGWRREELFQARKSALAGKESLDDKLTAFRDILEADGHLVDLTRSNGSFLLTQHHCPISKIAAEFRDACKHELQLYRDLIGKNVMREQSLAEGAPSCMYVIPSN